MNETLVIREGKWVWLSYLFVVIVFSYAGFFAAWCIRGFGLARSRRRVAALAVEDGKSKAVNVFVRFSFGLRLILAALSFLCLWLVWQDTFSGFTRIRIRSDDVLLRYMWPIPDQELPREAIRAVRLEPWGKGSSVLEVVSSTGKEYRSVSGEASDIRARCAELQQNLSTLVKKPDRKGVAPNN